MIGSTKERLIAAAMRLIAEQGLRATTVGQIEQAAGLTPRGGSFYRHFATKEAILPAAVELHIVQSERNRAVLDLLPLGDLRSELTLLCRWLLETVDLHRDVLQVIEREGDHFPEVRDHLRQQLIEPTHGKALQFVHRSTVQNEHPPRDPEASVVIMIGAAVNYRRMQWTYGCAPLDIDDGRFVAAWVEHTYESITGRRVQRQ